MTRALMPGRWNRHGRAVPDVQASEPLHFDARNCYMTDEEVAIRERAVMSFERVDSEHNLPAFLWWLIVAVVGVGGFVGGILLGSAQ